MGSVGVDPLSLVAVGRFWDFQEANLPPDFSNLAAVVLPSFLVLFSLLVVFKTTSSSQLFSKFSGHFSKVSKQPKTCRWRHWVVQCVQCCTVCTTSMLLPPVYWVRRPIMLKVDQKVPSLLQVLCWAFIANDSYEWVHAKHFANTQAVYLLKVFNLSRISFKVNENPYTHIDLVSIEIN